MATLTDTSTVTEPDGSTITTNTYSDGRVETVFVPAAGSSVANQQSLQSKAQAALTTNATFQAIASPNNSQNAAQIQALTRQVNALIRLAVGMFDSTTGT